MRRFVYLIFAVAAASFLLCGCHEKDEVQHRIVGEWKHVDNDSAEYIEIRIAFDVDYTFQIYQKLGKGIHRRYTGKYAVNRAHVTGVYSDGTPWASEYNVKFSNQDMVMTSTSADGYSVTYVRERIPDEVKENYVDVTKSIEEEIYPFL